MNIKKSICTIAFLVITISNAHVSSAMSKRSIDENRVIDSVKQAEAYINRHGKNKAISEFKNFSKVIFAIDFDGTFLASPLYPELIGTNQINFQDPKGNLLVQEEIEKAKAGGGWLKGRWRKNPETGKYLCRKLYIHPMPGNYLIGSWYYYTPAQEEKCLI